MAKGSREKKTDNAVLGWVLIIILLVAIAAGAFALYKATSYWHAKSVPAAADETPTSAISPVLPEETVQPLPSEPLDSSQPEQPTQPEEIPEVPAEPSQPERVTLMALGDDLIHNCIYWSAEQPDGSYDFTPFYEDIRPIAESYDLACINQETILVEDPALYGNYPYFGTPDAVGDALAQAGFDVITHATNHCYDKGDTGILDSVRFWRENYPEITVLGIHDSQEDADTLRVVEKNGIRIAMLNYTYGLNYGLPANRYMVDTLSSRDQIAAELASAKANSDFVVVFVHWGEEGSYKPDDSQTSWAQFFADHGAGVVIGAHPHVIQPLQTIQGADGTDVPIFYSLGNFFSHQVDVQNMLGGMASLTLERTEDGSVQLVEYEMKPTINVIIRRPNSAFFDYRPMLLEDYTEEIAAQHRFEGCTVDAMWSLYREITGEI